MFCKNCGRQLNDTAKFCKYCGQVVEKINTIEIKTEEKSIGTSNTALEEHNKDVVIINKTLKQIADHLEFLGYKIEKLEIKEQGNKEFVIASHSKNNNILFWEIFANFVMFKVSLTTGKKQSAQINTFINDANKKLDITKIYYDVENNFAVLRFEAIYIGLYSKETFGQFYEFFENDQKKLNLIDNFSKIFLN